MHRERLGERAGEGFPPAVPPAELEETDPEGHLPPEFPEGAFVEEVDAPAMIEENRGGFRGGQRGFSGGGLGAAAVSSWANLLCAFAFTAPAAAAAADGF